MGENCECFGSELDRLRASPETLVGQVQAKGIDCYPFFRHVQLPNVTKVLPRDYDLWYAPGVLSAYDERMAIQWGFRHSVSTRNRYQCWAIRGQGRAYDIAQGYSISLARGVTEFYRKRAG